MGARSPLPQYGALIHRVRTHSLLRVQDTPLVRIRWIHAGNLPRSPSLLGSRPYVHHLCLLLRRCHNDGSRLLAGLLLGGCLLEPDGGPHCLSSVLGGGPGLGEAPPFLCLRSMSSLWLRLWWCHFRRYWHLLRQGCYLAWTCFTSLRLAHCRILFFDRDYQHQLVYWPCSCPEH